MSNRARKTDRKEALAADSHRPNKLAEADPLDKRSGPMSIERLCEVQNILEKEQMHHSRTIMNLRTVVREASDFFFGPAPDGPGNSGEQKEEVSPSGVMPRLVVTLIERVRDEELNHNDLKQVAEDIETIFRQLGVVFSKQRESTP